LIGQKDDWVPQALCKTINIANNSQFEIALKIYENAGHCFDWEGIDVVYQGHTLKYNPEAAKDAVSRVKNFLAKYLK
jgi:dienelactone hydrolase